MNARIICMRTCINRIQKPDDRINKNCPILLPEDRINRKPYDQIYLPGTSRHIQPKYINRKVNSDDEK